MHFFIVDSIPHIRIWIRSIYEHQTVPLSKHFYLMKFVGCFFLLALRFHAEIARQRTGIHCAHIWQTHIVCIFRRNENEIWLSQPMLKSNLIIHFVQYFSAPCTVETGKWSNNAKIGIDLPFVWLKFCTLYTVLQPPHTYNSPT